ncbi:MAG: type II toxin-antitoxin system ParD family antitoxin [Magnetococcales bacterium]|nr:type II toxin-antitoxin system ParD family antitoxin [Magnetococcales bacterium]
MNISLTPHLEGFVKAKVDSGFYGSASEVMREALRLLEERDKMREIKLGELRRDIQDGLDSGPATSLVMGDIKARGRARLAAQNKQG